jgi:hypothetical protein
MAVPENLASSPAEMRVSLADYPFPGRWGKGDRPSEKRKVGSSILPLTTTSEQRKRRRGDHFGVSGHAVVSFLGQEMAAMARSSYLVYDDRVAGRA